MSNTIERLFGHLRPTIEAWRQPQIELGSVIRWPTHSNIPNYPIRKQDTGAHVHGLIWLCHILNAVIREAGLVGFNHHLLLQAITIHDHGEGITHSEHGMDIAAFAKCDNDDLAEYLAFRARIESLIEPVQYELHRAFLLQFGTKSEQDCAIFPEDAREVLRSIRSMYIREARAHAFLERVDYVYYAIEQGLYLGNVRIMVQVLRYNTHRLDAMVEQMPTLNVLWSRQTSADCKAFLHDTANLFPEFSEHGVKEAVSAA